MTIAKDESHMNKKSLAKQIRTIKPKDNKRRPCYICNRWESITHCHHIVDVSDIAEICLEYGVSPFLLPYHFVWLCPNHHEWWHRLRDKDVLVIPTPPRLHALMSEIESIQERQQVQKLLGAVDGIKERIKNMCYEIRGMEYEDAIKYVADNPIEYPYKD